MSRGQVPRDPFFFPDMKHRARKRHPPIDPHAFIVLAKTFPEIGAAMKEFTQSVAAILAPLAAVVSAWLPNDEDFYEEDEPMEVVRAIMDREPNTHASPDTHVLSDTRVLPNTCALPDTCALPCTHASPYTHASPNTHA